MVKRKDLQCPDYWKSFLAAVFGKKFLDTLAGGCLMLNEGLHKNLNIYVYIYIYTYIYIYIYIYIYDVQYNESVLND